jgi:16S rRNA processing protein RimM
MESAWLPFGVLRRPHGTSGEIALAPFNASGARLDGRALPMRVLLWTAEGGAESDLVSCRPVAEGYLVRLQGHASREAVAELVGHEVHLPRAVLAPLSQEEFYVEDVVGCEVVTVSGKRLGKVAHTFWNGAQDVMTVVDDQGGEQLVPVVAEFVHSFDREQRRLVVDPHE